MAKPTVALFSDSNFLSLNLVENLLSKNCAVLVVAPDKNSWLAKVKHIANKTNLEILNEKDFSGSGSFSYAIFYLGFEKFKRVYQTYSFRNVKSLAIFPFDSFDPSEDSRLPVSGNLGVVYLGDIMGPRIDFSGEFLIQEVIEKAINKREMSLAIGEVFYPMFVTDAAREIVKWIFSFGPYGKEIFLLGNQTSGTLLWQGMRKLIPDLELSYDGRLKSRPSPKGYEVKTLPCNLVFVLRETFNWIARNRVSTKPRGIKVPDSKRMRIALAVILSILLFPFLCLLLNAGIFYWSARSFMSGNTERARELLLLSKAPSFIGQQESRVLSYIPLLGIVYRETGFALGLSTELSETGVNAVYLADGAKELTDKILGNEIYDSEKYSSEIKVNLDYVYQALSFAEVDTRAQADKGVYLARRLLKSFDFTKAKKLASEMSAIVDRLGIILGKNEKASYLVLFQNNMELRPTGGFIGSFGIMTFEGGRMIDLSVSDVYSADGQLRGHVEPPEAIKEHLGEANWWLRDSNWDPDFPTSAERAEWFLDKEIDRQVDGVISFDLFPVKDLLAVTGPIYLADYQMDVTSENLYEKTQGEVHEEFFPGTHKKASFLTALSRNLVTEVSRLSSGKKLEVLKVLYQSLEQRHIQAYLHDVEVQSSISSLNWSGEVSTLSCGENCYADLVGVVEANVGVNKANYFITRDQELNIQVLPDKITRELKLTIRNSANPDLGLVGKYKAYIRVIMPEDSEPKEMGFLAEVLGGDTQEFIISWSSPRRNTRDYNLYVRKQAGTGEEDKVSVAINGELLYNSSFTHDLWIQKP